MAAVNSGQARIAVATWLDAFATALENRDHSGLRGLFLGDAFWRDLLAMTWGLRTFAGPDAIARGLVDALTTAKPGAFSLGDDDTEVVVRSRWGESIESFFRFDTDAATCRGHLRLRRDETGAWRAWTLATSTDQLKGYEEHAGERRPRQVGEPAPGDGEPQVVVLGAGQAGLTLAARLGQLDVDAVVLERNPRVGDNWRQRYRSLVLHNEVWANHLPYLPFPATWPVYLSKDQIADWLETYAEVLGIQVRLATSVDTAEYDEHNERWTVRTSDADGVVRVLRPRHLVLATGVFGRPKRLALPGAETFTGSVRLSVDYEGGRPRDGVRALVIGSGNSAHDVAQDLYECGADVTLLQRSSTCVVSVDPGAARAYSIYSEHGKPVDDCDLISNSYPFPLLAELHKDMTKRIAELDADLLAGLRAAGFALDFGTDGSGFLMKYHRTGGGYYINVGCSELIAAGRIKVRQGVEVRELAGDTVRFTDGTSMAADLVVVAAGFENMSESVRALLGDEVAERVGPVWGLDDEGEVRAMWRRTGQPGLWLCGGSLQQCRPFSKYLALQIKAIEEGLAPPR